jgi:hypothetical protein
VVDGLKKRLYYSRHLLKGKPLVGMRFKQVCRGIAQSGSAPALGAGCREFESLYPDHLYLLSVGMNKVLGFVERP